MPIEADIPLEIDGYQKKIVFGLTLRQLICLPVAILMAVGAFFLCTGVLGLPQDTVGWPVILAAAPALAVGFVRPHGEPFERVFLRRLRRVLGPSRLCYSAEPDLETPTTIRKGGTSYGYHPPVGENTFRYRPSRADRKRKRKQAACRIAAAQKEYRAAAAQARRAQRAARRAEKQR